MSDFERIRPAISHYEQLARIAHGADFAKQAASDFAEMQRKYYSTSENPAYNVYKYSVAHGYYI